MTGDEGHSDAEAPVTYEVAEGVASLTLNRPEKRNALNAVLVTALLEALERAERDDSARVVLLKGAGKDFCAGADLAELEKGLHRGAEAHLADANRLGELFIALRRLEKPVLAAVHGRALAGGCGLALACDGVLAEEGAEFGFPEVHLGFVPAMVMAILRRKVSEGRAFELVTLGERISAGAAVEIGLVNRIFPPGRFSEEAVAYAENLASRPFGAVRLSKRLLYGLDGLSFEEGIRRGAEVNALARSRQELRDGLRKFLRRKGNG